MRSAIPAFQTIYIAVIYSYGTQWQCLEIKPAVVFDPQRWLKTVYAI